jgi:uncharacterized membrane protein
MSTPSERSPERPRRPRAAWGRPAASEPRWQARLAIVVAALLYLTLPSRYTLGPVWLFPSLEMLVLVVLIVGIPTRLGQTWTRVVAIGLIAILNLANFVSLALLVERLLHGKNVLGTELLYSSISIWVTNVIVFALWYWELDRGGPDERRRANHPEPDFLFPQMVTPGCALESWTPVFVDYLYVAFTNATAFSPTDTMPLTPWAKMLMLVQSVVSLLTITLVAARAVNILS